MAVTMNRAQLRLALGIDADTAERLLKVATELCERYAPGAPEAIANEAVIRCARMAGRYGQIPSLAIGAIRRRGGATWAPGQISALRHSGAMALLSPWKQRRAGAI